MKQNVKKRLFSNCVLVDKELYFFDSYDGMPAKMNLNSGQVFYLNLPYNYNITNDNVADLILQNNKKIYILQNAGNNLSEYNLEQNTCRQFNINCAYQPWGNFAAATIFEAKLYIFTRYENKIVKFDTNTDKICEKIYIPGEGRAFFGCRVYKTMWLFPRIGDNVVAYDMQTDEVYTHRLPMKLEECVYAIQEEGKIYILNQYGMIYIWNLKKNNMEVVDKAEASEHVISNTVGRIVYTNHKLVILPSFGNDIKILDLIKNTVEIYSGYPNDFKYFTELKWAKYNGVCEDSEYFYFALRLSNYLLRIQKNNATLDWIKPIFPDENEKIKILLENGQRMFRELDYNLEDFVLNIRKPKDISQVQVDYGKQIFEKMAEKN